MFAEREHAHLRLAAALEPQPRRKVRKGGGGGLAHPDRARHAQDLRSQTAAVMERHSLRTAVFGIDPDLVLVIEFNRLAAAMQDALSRSGLQLLGATGRQVVAAFSSDPELTAFLSRMGQYEQGIPSGAKVARYEDLFDADWTEHDLADLRNRGLIVHEVSRYRATYAVDSIHLDELFQGDHIPVVHMGQIAGIAALR